MSKQFNDPLDVLNALDASSEPEQNAPKPSKPKSRKSRKPSFDDPLEAVSSQQINRATESKGMAGRFKRKTFLIYPQQLDYLYQIAEAEGMGVMETHRWLMDVALKAYDEGTRPEVETKTVRVRAKMKHWSGQ